MRGKSALLAVILILAIVLSIIGGAFLILSGNYLIDIQHRRSKLHVSLDVGFSAQGTYKSVCTAPHREVGCAGSDGKAVYAKPAVVELEGNVAEAGSERESRSREEALDGLDRAGWRPLAQVAGDAGIEGDVHVSRREIRLPEIRGRTGQLASGHTGIFALQGIQKAAAAGVFPRL